MNECFEMSYEAFDLAERFQQPVFIATDLDLGMNNWMADPFQYPEKKYDRGKVLNADDLDRIKTFARYQDVDGDGIPYRTLPGTEHPLAAYFTRGSGHDETAAYTEKPEDFKKLMDRLTKKHETAKSCIPQPEIIPPSEDGIGIIAFGSSDPAVRESLIQLEEEEDILPGYYRIRALPLTHHLEEFVGQCHRVYVVDQNRDGQMGDLVKLEIPKYAGRIRKILHYNGLPIDARSITDEIVRGETEEKE
jgi:2-oxoglutarate ferredoxin oxidoreductase subunit alpha